MEPLTNLPLQIAVLGTGNMGFPVARRLCQAGHRVRVWNRDPGKAAPLTAFGADCCDSAAAAVAEADFVISLLLDGAAVGAVLFGSADAAHAMRPGTLVIDMASIKPSQAREHSARLGEMGISHLDAPVSGGTVAAEDGTLAIMVGGRAGTFERAQPVLRLLGRATLVGPSGSGQLAKLANQMIVGITIGAVAEALLLAAKGGADMAKVREAISGGFADSRILQLHGQRMIQRDFVPRARMTVQRKDLRNALDTAQELSFVAPVTALFEQLYSAAIEHGLGELDHAGLFVELARRNGLCSD